MTASNEELTAIVRRLYPGARDVRIEEQVTASEYRVVASFGGGIEIPLSVNVDEGTCKEVYYSSTAERISHERARERREQEQAERAKRRFSPKTRG
jgi:hypothetical protein